MTKPLPHQKFHISSRPPRKPGYQRDEISPDAKLLRDRHRLDVKQDELWLQRQVRDPWEYRL